MLRIWSPNSFVFWTNQFYAYVTRLWLYHVSKTICSLSFRNTTRSYVQCQTRKLHRGMDGCFPSCPQTWQAHRDYYPLEYHPGIRQTERKQKNATNIWNNVFQLESFLQIDWFISCVERNLRFCWEPPDLYLNFFNKEIKELPVPVFLKMFWTPTSGFGSFIFSE